MSDTARTIDANNPSDVRDQTGAPVTQKRVVFSAQFNQEDAKAFAELHAMLGNNQRSNELRTLAGEKPRGVISSMFNTRLAFTVKELLLVTGASAATVYGIEKFRAYRRQKKLEASKTSEVNSTKSVRDTPPPPFMVAK